MAQQSHGAVFLSYASQDAAAAKRICEALRGAGIEVWFDLNELRGGDAWDQKIRRQIKECALFVPVVSANTQARPEGYFRLEWKLAVDRSHLMADDQPFLLPVVIDDTPEAAARVPDRFRDVQWTRLRLDETPGDFSARVQALLAGGSGAARRPAAEVRGTKNPATLVWTVVPVAGMLFGLLFVIRPGWLFSRRSAPKPERAAATAATTTEARRLVAKARALFEPWDGATREDFVLAEQLLKRAVELDPADGEVWAAYGVVLCGQLAFGHERARARWELARSATERAVRLAPQSYRARFAQAFYFRLNDATSAQAETLLRELAEQAPADKLVLRTLAAKLRDDGKFDEALAILDRAAALPGGDPVAWYQKYRTLWSAHRYDEAAAVIDAALEKFPAPYLYSAKVKTLMALRGDLDAAAEALGKIAPTFALEDGPVFSAARLWLWRREPEKCLAVLRGVSRDVIENDFGGPKAVLAGKAHQLAGRVDAAKVEWGAALQVVEAQLAAEPNSHHWSGWKTQVLALLGRTAEAEAALRVFEQLSGSSGPSDHTAALYLSLGRRDEVLAVLAKRAETIAARRNPGERAVFVNALRYDPDWDAVRDDPRFQKLVAAAASP